jgi:hypothetical protein
MQVDHRLRATKHMTPHKAAFDMYEVIPTRNVHMGDDSIGNNLKTSKK